MLFGVDMLANSLRIIDTTKTESFQLTFLQSDEKTWQNYFRGEFSSVSDLLTCWMSITVLTRCSLGIYVTKLFAAYNLWNTLAMRLIFFEKCSKFDGDFRNVEKISEKDFGAGHSSIGIGGVNHSPLRRENTCFREWKC